jgi:cell division protease FtsH
MELHGIAGGVDEGLVGPSSSAPLPGRRSPFPLEVAEVLSYLANLIDRSIALRGVGTGVRNFAAHYLEVPSTQVVATTAELGTMAFQLAALAFADDMGAHPPSAIIGEEQDAPPRWEVLDLGELRVPVPFSLAAAFPAGGLARCPLIVFFDETFQNGKFTVTVYSRSVDAGGGRGYLDDLLIRSRARTNPFKGRVLETVHDDRYGLTFKVVALPCTTRDEVVLPDDVWDEVDRNVHGFFAALDRLKAAGLACNRGILLEGPPGTGKTALCRAIAGELDATVVFCDAASVSHGVHDLYRELVHLAPALVVMEDIDLVVGHRQGGGSDALLNFLLALDGAVSEHEGVVTIATTNDVRGIDDAARRSARFDRVVTVPPPDRAGRAGILARYLRSLDVTVDLAAVTAATGGLTGADLRELVSLALLHAAEEERHGGAGRVTTEMLVRLAQDTERAAPAGQYL